MSKSNFRISFWSLLLLLPVLFFTACGEDTPMTPEVVVPEPMPEPEPEPSTEILINASASAAEDAQRAFIEVESGFTIIFGEGTFSFTNTLSMDGKESIIIKGAGRDKTFLNFSSQTAGGDGVLVTNSTNIRFEDLTVQDSKGDALKTRECNTVSFVNVGTVWSGEPSTENGAYGLYPVLCTEVYIDNCYAFGASDAGIYVGQSDQVIVKNSIAEGNVAGIEIENTTNADVFDNEAFDNTGGILIFDLPGLTQSGKNSRVFNNKVHNNNRPNFAPEGNIVSNVPTGTGIMVLSTKDVEIFNNTIDNNTFAGVLLTNYLIINSSPSDPNYDPYPSGIFVHDNMYSKTDIVDILIQPDLIKDIILLITLRGFELPDILTDGLLVGEQPICIQEMEASFVNLNAADPTFEMVTDDLSPQDCVKEPLPEISFMPF